MEQKPEDKQRLLKFTDSVVQDLQEFSFQQQNDALNIIADLLQSQREEQVNVLKQKLEEASMIADSLSKEKPF